MSWNILLCIAAARYIIIESLSAKMNSGESAWFWCKCVQLLLQTVLMLLSTVYLCEHACIILSVLGSESPVQILTWEPVSSKMISPNSQVSIAHFRRWCLLPSESVVWVRENPFALTTNSVYQMDSFSRLFIPSWTSYYYRSSFQLFWDTLKL